MANKLYRKERFAGCLIGAAAGDALGAPVKTLKTEQIKKSYGKKGILKPALEKGQKYAFISDETQLMLFTAHGLLWADNDGALYEMSEFSRYVFYAYQQWLFTQTGGVASEQFDGFINGEGTEYPCELLDNPELNKKRSPTKQLLQTLSEIKSFDSCGTILHPINENKLFDCVPRVIPAGLYFSNDPQTAFRMGCEFAAITHGSPDGYLAAGALAAIIAYICRGNTVEKATIGAIKLAREYSGSENCCEALEKALSLLDGESAPLEDVASLGRGEDAVSALAIGVYCAAVHYDYISAVQLAANHDGISDACAAIAGALKGAYLGYYEIPKKFTKRLQLADTVKKYALALSKNAPKK